MEIFQFLFLISNGYLLQNACSSEIKSSYDSISQKLNSKSF